MGTLCMITLIQETEINSPTRTPNCAAERSPKDVLLCLALCERLVSVQAVIMNCRKFHDELRKQKCRAEKRENKHRLIHTVWMISAYFVMFALQQPEQ